MVHLSSIPEQFDTLTKAETGGVQRGAVWLATWHRSVAGKVVRPLLKMAIRNNIIQ